MIVVRKKESPIVMGMVDMQVSVEFQDERLGLDVPEGLLIDVWHGPTGVASSDVPRLVLDALENPRQYPALRLAVVPGDRVVIAFDPEVPEPRPILDTLCRMLLKAGVEPDAITVLLPASSRDEATPIAPEGTHVVVHDPDDKTQLAYLANTTRERRIYLNRLLTDADLVVPVGRIGPDPVLGYKGPWSVIFPGMSNRETLGAFRAQASDDPPNPREPRASLVESSEVSWLLGCQFHVGIVAGTNGLVEVVAGIDSAVREQGTARADQVWTFRPASRAELVIVGIGNPAIPTGLDDLAAGLTTATRLVQHGGKIVALSRAKGAIGPALGRLIEEADSRSGAAALRGHEHDPDYNAARQLARALAWADVYLLSDLDPQMVDDLSIIALGRPEEARRLAATCHSCLVVSHAEQSFASVADESE